MTPPVIVARMDLLPAGLPKSITADLARAIEQGVPGVGTPLWTRACTAALAHIAAEEAHERKRKADRERARYHVVRLRA